MSQHKYDPSAIQRLLLEFFDFNNETLTIFCYDYFRGVYQGFKPGVDLEAKARGLIDHCEIHNLLNDLLSLLWRLDPNKYASLFPLQEIEEVSILLIGDSGNDLWRQIIEGASTSLGKLQITREMEALQLLLQQNYSVIVIDAENVTQETFLIRFVKTRESDAKIVVATSAPNWQRTRKAFLAGATDYIRKPNDTMEMCTILLTVIGSV